MATIERITKLENKVHLLMKMARSQNKQISKCLKNKTRGGRKKRKRRVTRGKRRTFKKGTKSKTHRGKDFETRKTSKNYNSKRWKRLIGRRTRRAPLFPWA